ncbi:MAG: peptidylprolyl isomerase, partial [Paracoccaceae bacterium]
MAIRKFVTGAVLAAMLGLTGPAMAQENPFGAYLYVGDRVITNFELDQRARFVALLRSPGDPLTQAREALIDDKLRLIEAEKLGIVLTEEAIQAGLAEFAGRANLTAEQFTAAIGQGGIEPQTFRD